MAETFEVKGLKELEKELIKLGAKLGVKTLTQAGRQAMKPVLNSAKQKANIDSGDLKASLAITTRLSRNKKSVLINVGTTKTKALKSQGGHQLAGVNQKAIAQEFGTSKQKAEPFLRPALTQNAGKVLSIFRSELAVRIKKAGQ